MGEIHLEDMEFYAFHGHFKEEQIVGNRFLVNLTLKTDMVKAGQSDNLEDALNYQTAYEIVQEEMNKKSHLLEHIARRILDALYKRFDTLKHAHIKVSKMNPPMGGKMESVSVTMER
ncbi:MAG TPA: dihydroneopterin aldolase [Bacteroidales bacterium]|nr:dihydroneopterin aldolase [Bacteroidales bacterium]